MISLPPFSRTLRPREVGIGTCRNRTVVSRILRPRVVGIGTCRGVMHYARIGTCRGNPRGCPRGCPRVSTQNRVVSSRSRSYRNHSKSPLPTSATHPPPSTSRVPSPSLAVFASPSDPQRSTMVRVGADLAPALGFNMGDGQPQGLFNMGNRKGCPNDRNDSKENVTLG